jgi:hypothetical protein
MIDYQQFLHEMWLKHCEEYLQWFHQMPTYNFQDYYTKYEEWLKEQYDKGPQNDD